MEQRGSALAGLAIMDRVDTNRRDGTTGAAPTIDAETFEALRRYLFTVAYRLVGSASEAEDIVQDAYLRVQDAAGEPIASPKAYLTTIVTRLSLDYLRSARATRETYTGPWLPEPVPTADLVPSPETTAELSDDVSLAFILLLERLTPEERATYVLREAFAYPYETIGEILGKSSGAVRQVAHRARQRVAAGGSRFRASPERQRHLTAQFLAASHTGDLTGLTNMLTDDVVARIDGGAATLAARRPIEGADAVSRWLVGLMAKAFPNTRATYAGINGDIACLLWDDARLAAVISLAMTERGVASIQIVINPEKLAYLERRRGTLDGEVV